LILLPPALIPPPYTLLVFVCNERSGPDAVSMVQPLMPVSQTPNLKP